MSVFFIELGFIFVSTEKDVRHPIRGSSHLFADGFKIKYSYENGKNGFKFVLYRPQLQSDMMNVTLDVTLNGTEMAVLAILKQKPDSSREEVADKISKTVRTVQRALDSLRDKGYIQRVGSKQTPMWEVLK